MLFSHDARLCGMIDEGTADYLFELYELTRHPGNSHREIDEFIRRFADAWRCAGHADAPDPRQVWEMVDSFDARLIALWHRLAPAEELPVCIASLPGKANPFVVKQAGTDPLIVMCLGLWGLVFECMLGLLTYVDDEVGEDRGLDFAKSAMRAWVYGDPALSRGGIEAQRLAVLNQETTAIAVGIAHCALTWAYFHEVAHLTLGHVGSDEGVLRSAAEPALEISAPIYSHQQEFEADQAGVDALLALMEQEQDIRRTIEFGPSGDHAASILFDIMDIAYRMYPERDQRVSATHPPPSERSERLRSYAADRSSLDGIGFYKSWREILEFSFPDMRQA